MSGPRRVRGHIQHRSAGRYRVSWPRLGQPPVFRSFTTLEEAERHLAALRAAPLFTPPPTAGAGIVIADREGGWQVNLTDHVTVWAKEIFARPRDAWAYTCHLRALGARILFWSALRDLIRATLYDAGLEEPAADPWHEPAELLA